MTQDLIFNEGEEYLIKNGFDGQSVVVGLYLDDSAEGGDDLDEFATFSEISTEPTSSNYSSVNITLSANQTTNNNWVGENTTQLLFDFQDVVQGDSAAQDVDTAYVYADDGNQTLLANPSMTTIRNTAAFDELEVAPADFGIGVDGTA